MEENKFSTWEKTLNAIVESAKGYPVRTLLIALFIVLVLFFGGLISGAGLNLAPFKEDLPAIFTTSSTVSSSPMMGAVVSSSAAGPINSPNSQTVNVGRDNYAPIANGNNAVATQTINNYAPQPQLLSYKGTSLNVVTSTGYEQIFSLSIAYFDPQRTSFSMSYPSNMQFISEPVYSPGGSGVSFGEVLTYPTTWIVASFITDKPMASSSITFKIIVR